MLFERLEIGYFWGFQKSYIFENYCEFLKKTDQFLLEPGDDLLLEVLSDLRAALGDDCSERSCRHRTNFRDRVEQRLLNARHQSVQVWLGILELK